MPLTAMADMPDGLQALKRENILGDEHVLGAHVWTGDNELFGLGEPPVGGGTDIPLSTGMQVHLPDFNTIRNPGDLLNTFANAAAVLTANKLAKKNQLRTPPPVPGGGGAGGGPSIIDDIKPYAPLLILGALGLGALAYIGSKKGG